MRVNDPAESESMSIDRRTLLKQGATATALFAGFGSAAVTPVAADEVCKDGELDVVLVLDESGSMGWEAGKMQAAKDGAKSFIDNLDSASDLVGLVSFNHDPQTEIDLTSNFSSVKSAIDGLQAGGGTDIGAAVDAGHDEISDNGRNSANPILVLLSNGNSNYTDAVTQAQEAKDDGIRVITIGYGSGADTSLLKDVASDPDEDNFFDADQDNIEDIFDTIAQEVCQEVNQPPNAVIDVTTDEPVLGEPVTFDGSGSSDPDGDSLTFEWDLDGDGTFEESGEKVTTTFEECDTTRTVTLRVSDGNGGTDTATVTVTLSLPASIDIVPTVNPDGQGVIPVKVKSIDCGALGDLDVSTVRFGDPEDVDAGDGASPAHDGHLNKKFLMLHFPTPDADFEGDEDIGKLVGELNDGTGVVGTDEIKFAGGGGNGSSGQP